MSSEKMILDSHASNLNSLAQQNALLIRNQLLLKGDEHSSTAKGLSLTHDWIAAPENPKQSWIAVPVPSDKSSASTTPRKLIHSGAHKVVQTATSPYSEQPAVVESHHSVVAESNLPKPRLLSKHAAVTRALRRKAFHDLQKAKAEINQLELASGVSRGLDDDDTLLSDAGSASRQSEAISSVQSHRARSASWTAIPVPSPARRHRASTQEASIVAELLRDVVSASARARGRNSRRRRAVAKPRIARKAEILHQETPAHVSKHSTKSSGSLSSELEPAQDGPLTADQAEKAAEATELRAKRGKQCDACLDQWSAGARYCVMTVCHLHTSASLLAAPKVGHCRDPPPRFPTSPPAPHPHEA